MAAVKFDIRLVPSAPDGDRLGILHHASRTRAALPLNDVPALDLTYTRGMPGAEWLEGFCEVALERNTGADWQEEPNGRFVRTRDRKSTRLNSSHVKISYAVFG